MKALDGPHHSIFACTQIINLIQLNLLDFKVLEFASDKLKDMIHEVHM